MTTQEMIDALRAAHRGPILNLYMAVGKLLAEIDASPESQEASAAKSAEELWERHRGGLGLMDKRQFTAALSEARALAAEDQGRQE